MARVFAAEQRAPLIEVQGYRALSWVELTCPQCRGVTYVPDRDRRLVRTGSQREYACCVHCGAKLTAGRVIEYPFAWKTPGETVEVAE